MSHCLALLWWFWCTIGPGMSECEGTRVDRENSAGGGTPPSEPLSLHQWTNGLCVVTIYSHHLSSSLIYIDLHLYTSLYISLFRWSGWSEFHYDAPYSSQQNERVEIGLLPRLREWKMTDWCLRWCHACLCDTHWSKPYETPIQSTWGPLSLEMYSVSWIINDQWSWYSSCISPARSSNNRNHRNQYIMLYNVIYIYINVCLLIYMFTYV